MIKRRYRMESVAKFLGYPAGPSLEKELNNPQSFSEWLDSWQDSIKLDEPAPRIDEEARSKGLPAEEENDPHHD